MHPTYFVYKDAAEVSRINEAVHARSAAEIATSLDLSLGSACWSAQTFIHLHGLGCPVHLTTEIQTDAINVLHVDAIGFRTLPRRGFLVVVRADRPRPVPADLVVVQNKCCIHNARRDTFIPHWPQPGLIPRDPDRGNRLERIAYFGIEAYARSEVYSTGTRQRLAELGIALDMRFEPDSWTDYSKVDAVLAVRSATEYDKDLKPPSKLVNAWRAGVVGFMGAESGYRQVGTPGENYIEVSSPDALLRWCMRIRQEPELYGRIVQCGRQAEPAFSTEAIARTWIEYLEGPVEQAFERWTSRPEPYRRAKQVLMLPLDLLARRRERAIFEEGIGLRR